MSGPGNKIQKVVMLCVTEAAPWTPAAFELVNIPTSCYKLQRAIYFLFAVEYVTQVIPRVASKYTPTEGSQGSSSCSQLPQLQH